MTEPTQRTLNSLIACKVYDVFCELYIVLLEIHILCTCNIPELISHFIKFWLLCLKFETMCKEVNIKPNSKQKWEWLFMRFPLPLEEPMPSGGV